MPLSNAAIRAIMIRRSESNRGVPPVAANDQPRTPRQRAVLPDFVTPLVATEMKVGETGEGKPYMTLKGCEMVLPSGVTAVRTAMAFDDAFVAVRDAIQAQRDVVATVTHMGGVMKVVGLEIDGRMTTFARRLPKAA